jgi:hypothetical protein
VRYRSRIRRIIRRARRDGAALWRFFRYGDTKRDRLRRARGIVFVAEARARAGARKANLANYRLTHADDLTRAQKERLRRIRRNGWEQHEKWQKFRVAYNRKAKRLQQAIQDGQDGGDFELWMLSGHSANISEGTKKLVVWIVGHGGIITDTYDFSGHTPSSLHYPRNNADGKGHAVDWVPASCSGTVGEDSAMDHFGAGFFKELFGPCSVHVKWGSTFTQGPPFPGHGDHEHGAPYS